MHQLGTCAPDMLSVNAEMTRQFPFLFGRFPSCARRWKRGTTPSFPYGSGIPRLEPRQGFVDFTLGVEFAQRMHLACC